MTAGTHHIDQPAHRHTPRAEAHRFVSMVAAMTRRPHATSGVRSHAGQLGTLREAEFGRRSGARI
jgi:hypothetical protein